MRILFKEDDPLAARTLERQLRKLGHATERIDDIRALLERKTELEPDIIITDIFMPDIEGLEFIRMLKRSSLGQIPVIAISGGGQLHGRHSQCRRQLCCKGRLRLWSCTLSPQANLNPPLTGRDRSLRQ